MKHIITIVFIIVSHLYAKSQSTATIFESGVISNDGIFGLTLSPEGNHALWVHSKGKRDTLIIKESMKINGKWQTPEITSFSGNVWKDIDPMFTPDGKTILFQSNRPMVDFPNRKRMDMWAVSKLKNGWSAPYHLGNVINTDSSESFASATKTGNIYFTKETGTQKGDLFYAEFKNGSYQAPINLSSINTSRRDANPFISPSEDYLIYASPKEDNENDSDLFISFKIGGQWAIPQNLGTVINSTENEFCPFVHKKQDRIYFSRLKRGKPKNIENTYFVSDFSKIIAKLKSTAKVKS